MYILIRLLEFYEILIVIWALFSWFPNTNGGLFADIKASIDSLVRPYVSVFQRFIPPIGGIDFSPVLAIVALNLIERAIFALL